MVKFIKEDNALTAALNTCILTPERPLSDHANPVDRASHRKKQTNLKGFGLPGTLN